MAPADDIRTGAPPACDYSDAERTAYDVARRLQKAGVPMAVAKNAMETAIAAVYQVCSEAGYESSPQQVAAVLICATDIMMGIDARARLPSGDVATYDQLVAAAETICAALPLFPARLTVEA